MPLPAEITIAVPEQEEYTLGAEPVAPETVLEAIRLDCQRAPDRYLDEVRVPFGGE